MGRICWLAAIAVMAQAAPWLSAHAQAPASRVSGTIEHIDAAAMTVRTASGTEIDVMLPPGVLITALVNRHLADIKPGDFVGSAAVKGIDGKLHAQEVHIFPDTLRGMGEGHRPMAGQDRSMTNAVVAGVAGASDGRELHLSYKGGEQTIEVGPTARIVGIIAADRAILRPGSAVLVLGVGQPGGGLRATMVQGEKDGVPPLN